MSASGQWRDDCPLGIGQIASVTKLRHLGPSALAEKS
jgi:hypothetical protein